MTEKTKPKKIAVIHYDPVSEIYPGVGCFKAFNEMKSCFEAYGTDTKTIAVFTCGGLFGQESILSGKCPEKAWFGCRAP